MVVDKKLLTHLIKGYDYDHFIKERLLFELEVFGKEKYVPLLQNAEYNKGFARTYELRCKMYEIKNDQEIKQRHNGNFYKNLQKASKSAGEIYVLSGNLGSLSFGIYLNEHNEVLFLIIISVQLNDYSKSMKLKRKSIYSRLLSCIQGKQHPKSDIQYQRNTNG